MPDLGHQAKLVAFGYSTIMPGCAISLKKGRLRHTTVKRIKLSIWLLYSIITAVPAVAVVSLTGLPRIGTWCGAFLMPNVALSGVPVLAERRSVGPMRGSEIPTRARGQPG
jgi:hypothetical protein